MKFVKTRKGIKVYDEMRMILFLLITIKVKNFYLGKIKYDVKAKKYYLTLRFYPQITSLNYDTLRLIINKIENLRYEDIKKGLSK